MKTQRIREAGRSRVALALVLGLFCLVAGARVHAQISSTIGDIVAVNRADVIAVGSLVEGAFTSDTEVRVFLEREDCLLTTDMDLDVTANGIYNYPLTPGTLAAGEWVSSVMIHANRASPGGPSHLIGTIEFSADIVGIVLEDGTLDGWDPVIGLASVTYPTGVARRGLEVDDGSWANPDEILLDGKILKLDFYTSSHTDQMRVILAGNARGVTFSVDFQGPAATLGLTPTWGPGVIDEGDILTVAEPGSPGPNGPVPGPTLTPAVMLEAADLGVTVPGMMDIYEVDALSFGQDRGSRLRFSVDEFAVGMPVGPTPSVYTEGALPGSNHEAAADVFAYRGPVTLTSPAFTPGNRSAIDGDGVAPTGRPGLGLHEPCPPTVHLLPDEGDNLDAIDIGTRVADLQGRVYFSLDARFPDWAETHLAPPNAGTAIMNGVSPADILVSDIGSGTFGIYVSATALGLSGSALWEDDIDALALWDDGDGTYEPGIDKILFSLRRGSSSLGMISPGSGLPIAESDVLIPGPRILIPGESLGLRTLRGIPPSVDDVPDDLDALDVIYAHSAPIGNGDQVEVGVGGLVEINVLANDFALDGHLVPASVGIMNGPVHGIIEHIDPQTGAVTYRHDGSNFGEDFFTYIVFDDKGEFTEGTRVYVRIVDAAIENNPVAAGGSVLSFASPNPFRSQVAFRLQAAQTGQARVAVFDPTGRQVRLLLREMLDAGATREITWDGCDDSGQPVTAGVFILQVQTPAGSERVRLLRVR